MSSSDAHARVRCRFENGTYHLIVAQMANGCGLDKWGSNSAVVRAESSSPTGPFRYKQTVLRPFAHNPTIRRLPSVHLGCPAAATTQCTRMQRSRHPSTRHSPISVPSVPRQLRLCHLRAGWNAQHPSRLSQERDCSGAPPRGARGGAGGRQHARGVLRERLRALERATADRIHGRRRQQLRVDGRRRQPVSSARMQSGWGVRAHTRLRAKPPQCRRQH